MHSDNGSVKASADFGNGQGRCISSEDAVLLADILQLFESLLLDFHILQSSFNNQITICADSLHTCCDFSKDSVSSSLLHFSLCHSLRQSLSDSVLSVCSEFLIDITQKNLIPFCLSKSLRYTRTHCTCTNNTNLHLIKPPTRYVLVEPGVDRIVKAER